MAEFRYVARQSSGQQVTGMIEAGNERDVLAQLSERMLFPVRVEEAVSRGLQRRWGTGVRSRHLAAMYGQLSDLLRSGVPLLRALEILEKQSSRPALSEVLRSVREHVAEGSGLAEAMERHPRVFNDLAVSMVRAGQEGGFLEDVLLRIARFTEQQEDLRSRVVGATAYPAFLLVFGTILVTALVIFFVPRFEEFFERLRENGELPVLTEGLLGLSEFLGTNWYWVGGMVILTGAALWSFRDSPRGRHLIDGWKLRLPGAGTIYRNLAIARFCRILGTLLHNGVPILQSLRIGKDSTGNRVLSDAIGASAENISTGESLSTPLRRSGHFPTDVVEMISVGEESNNLEEVLINIADATERRTTRNLELLVRLLEPVLLLVMAVVVLLVILALLLPMFKMSELV
jgi:general secretion pathway protein F